jgi:hypothetical protein
VRIAGDDTLLSAIHQQIESFKNDRADQGGFAFWFHNGGESAVPAQEFDVDCLGVAAPRFAAIRVAHRDRVHQMKPEVFGHSLRQHQHGGPRVHHTADLLPPHLVRLKKTIPCLNYVAVVGNLELDVDASRAVDSSISHDVAPLVPKSRFGNSSGSYHAFFA